MYAEEGDPSVVRVILSLIPLLDFRLFEKIIMISFNVLIIMGHSVSGTTQTRCGGNF